MKKIGTDILPLVLSILLILISFGVTLMSDYVLSNEHYFGIGFLVVAAILYFSSRKSYYLFFALTLTIGLVGFLDFFYISFKIGFAGFGINPIFLGLMILFFAFSKKQIDRLSPDKKELKERTLDENLVKSFETKFTDKPITELIEIAHKNSKFTYEARTAAKRLLVKNNL